MRGGGGIPLAAAPDARRNAVARKRRQQMIREIIAGEKVRSQRRLAELLLTRGVRVTQSTLSRDILEMGVVKAGAGYMQAPDGTGMRIPARDLRATLRAFVLGVEPVANHVVLKTTSGSANAAADVLDDTGWKEVAGTLAGDDTILVIARSSRQAGRVAQRIERLLR